MNEGTDDKVKLRVNMIIDNQMHRRDEIIDRSIIPQQLRSRKYYASIETEDSLPPPPTPKPVPRQIGEDKRRLRKRIDLPHSKG